MHTASPPLKLTLRLDANNANKLSLELEHRVGRNRSHSPSTVSPLRLNDQSPLLARAHVQKSLVPALDDLSLADVEGEWLAAVVGCVEFGSVSVEGAAVVDVDFVAWMLSVPCAFVDCGAGGHLPLFVFLVHSTALSTWMSRGLSSAETEANISASAETIDVRRMLCRVCWCVGEAASRFNWIVFTVEEARQSNESGDRGVLHHWRLWTLNSLSSIINAYDLCTTRRSEDKHRML